MKRWLESAAVWRRARELADGRRPAALATLFALEGSGYRRPGAKMLIEADGSTTGGVSAGCVEADLVERARPILGGAPAEVVEYATGGDDQPPWGLRTGCRGRLRLLLQRVSPPPAGVEIDAIDAAFGEEAPFAVVTRGRGAPGHLVVGPSARQAGSLGGRDLERALTARARDLIERGDTGVHPLGGDDFVEVLSPPPRITVAGAGEGAIPLVRLALEAGFLVRVVDHRSDALRRVQGSGAPVERARPGDPWRWEDPGERTFVILQTHALDHDRAWMRAIFDAGLPAYVGVLGSRDRGAEVAAEAPPEARDRIYAPLGLDVGAEGPEQIAVAAVAEMLAVWTGRRGGHLRRGAGSLHALAS